MTLVSKALIPLFIAVSVTTGEWSSGPSYAEVKPESGDQDSHDSRSNNWALIIGINQYKHLSPLRYSRGDARQFQRELTDSSTGLFCDSNVFVLSDENERSSGLFPSRKNILRYLDHVSKQAHLGERLLFYYSGHGFSESGTNYICPPDYRSSRPAETGVSLTVVNEKLRSSGAALQIVIVDACRASGKSVGHPFVDVPTRGRFDLFAAQADGYSYESDELKHGVFTAAILDGLDGSARRDSSGFITVESLKEYIEQFVHSWSERNRLVQTPRFGGDFQGKMSKVTISRRVD